MTLDDISDGIRQDIIDQFKKLAEEYNLNHEVTPTAIIISLPEEEA